MLLPSFFYRTQERRHEFDVWGVNALEGGGGEGVSTMQTLKFEKLGVHDPSNMVAPP